MKLSINGRSKYGKTSLEAVDVREDANFTPESIEVYEEIEDGCWVLKDTYFLKSRNDEINEQLDKMKVKF